MGVGTSFDCQRCGRFPLAASSRRRCIFNVLSLGGIGAVHFNLWFYDCARRVLYILGKWAIIEAELQERSSRSDAALGKELITLWLLVESRSAVCGRFDSSLTRTGNEEWRLLTRKRWHAICARLQKLSFADGQIGWLPRPPLLLLFEWCDACAVMESPQCVCGVHAQIGAKNHACGVTSSVKPNLIGSVCLPLNLITAILVDIIFLIWKVFNILLEGVITFW
jgi:hypothetical protein